MPLSAKPPGSSDEYINGQSRIDATQQMRAILENSCLDESILSSDLQPVCNGRPVTFTTKPAGDPTQQNSRDQASVSRNGPRSKFDGLYQQALRNAESILSDSSNPPDCRNDQHLKIRAQNVMVQIKKQSNSLTDFPILDQ